MRSVIFLLCLVGFLVKAARLNDDDVPIYDPTAAVAWLTQQGCDNSSIPNCPGGIPCTDAEWIARALAAGKAVTLDPNDQSSYDYQTYQAFGNTYNLSQTQDVQQLLQDMNWEPPASCDQRISPELCYPHGSVLMAYDEWKYQMPVLAMGGLTCTSHSPTVANGGHCGLYCPGFNPIYSYFPPMTRPTRALYGTFTPNNKSFPDLNTWVNTWNPPAEALNQALSVVDVGWSKDDATEVQAQLDYAWSTENAVPIITWMPYTYATWTSPTPNADIASGQYDEYLDQFLVMLSAWLAGSDRIKGTADDKRAYLRFAPQANGNWFPWSPLCPSCGGNGQNINQTTQSYVDMWGYVMKKVRSSTYSITADMLLTILDVNNVDAYDMPWKMEQFYPLDGSNVDWFCVTGFNWGTSLPGNNWITPSQVFSNMVQRVKALSSTTPLALCGATTSQPLGIWSKSSWITDFYNYTLETVQAKMVIYHNQDSSTDLAAFGGGQGTSTWNSPLTGLKYNVYRTLQDSINLWPFGLTGSNASNPRIISTLQFQGKF